MLFHVLSTHEPTNCPTINGPNDPKWTETMGKLLSDSFAADNDVRVHSMHVGAPEHKFVMLVEADDYMNLVNFLRPIKHIGHHAVTPVVDMRE